MGTWLNCPLVRAACIDCVSTKLSMFAKTVLFGNDGPRRERDQDGDLRGLRGGRAGAAASGAGLIAAETSGGWAGTGSELEVTRGVKLLLQLDEDDRLRVITPVRRHRSHAGRGRLTW